METETPKKRATGWDETSMENALEAVRDGMSINKAAKQFNIPRRTLGNHITSGTSTKRLGCPATLTPEQESELCSRVMRLANAGLPLTSKTLRESVFALCNELQIPHRFQNGSAGRKWLNLFLKRNPEVEKSIVRVTQPKPTTHVARASSLTSGEKSLTPKTRATGWNEESMEKALIAVRGGMTISRASIEFKIPRRTLRNHIASGMCTKKLGCPATLTVQQENDLCFRIMRLADLGLPMTSKELRQSVFNICNELQIRHQFQNGIAGRKWLNLFLKRHPDVAQSIARKTRTTPNINVKVE